MHTLYIGKKKYQLPSRWEELSRKQVIRAAWLSAQQLSSVQLAKLLFMVLTLSLPWYQRIRVQFFYLFQASIHERGDLVFLTRSLAEFTDFTTQKVKIIRGRFVPRFQFYGPASKLANCTFWEYVKAEQYFTAYMKSRDEEWLNKLIAVLYRLRSSRYDPNLHEDIRLPLIEASIPYRAKLIGSLPLPERIAILMWFDGCRQFIIKSFPLIYKKRDPQEGKPTSKLDQKAKSGDWLTLINSLSTDMLQFQQIPNVNLTVALTDISLRTKRAKEQAEAAKAQAAKTKRSTSKQRPRKTARR